MILRRRDDRHELRTSFGALPHLLNDHAVAFGVDLLPVLDELRVRRQTIVVADIEAEMILGRRDAALREKCRRHRGNGRSDEHQIARVAPQRMVHLHNEPRGMGSVHEIGGAVALP